MLYFNVNRAATPPRAIICRDSRDPSAECRHDWRTLEAAQEVANAAAHTLGEPYLATDEPWCRPQFDVIRGWVVGEPVSYGFNGDSYPDGYVAKVSADQRIVTTTTGQRYFRKGKSCSWKRAGTWSLGRGHHDERNPSF